MRRLALVLLVACGSSHAGGTTDARGDATPGADGPPDASSCGMRTGMRGLTKRAMVVGGLNRTYLVYLPMADSPATPVPLVLVFHGYTMSGQAMYDTTHYAELADSEHIALAFPDGQAGPSSLGAPWNVGNDLCPSTAGAPPSASGDDFAFIDAMKADIAQDQCLDTAHEYVTGFSMGGYFSHHVGCMRPDIRAVAPHSGGTHPLDQCVTGHKPIIIFHGLADPLIPDGCDDPGASSIPQGITPSAADWASKNGCSQTTHQIAVSNGTCYVFDGCPSDGQVELCTFNGMGHCWAGGTQFPFGCPNYESATQLEWNFFKQYAW